MQALYRFADREEDIVCVVVTGVFVIPGTSCRDFVGVIDGRKGMGLYSILTQTLGTRIMVWTASLQLAWFLSVSFLVCWWRMAGNRGQQSVVCLPLTDKLLNIPIASVFWVSGGLSRYGSNLTLEGQEMRYHIPGLDSLVLFVVFYVCLVWYLVFEWPVLQPVQG